MKQRRRRILSWILILMLLLSLLPGSIGAAQAPGEPSDAAYARADEVLKAVQTAAARPFARSVPGEDPADAVFACVLAQPQVAADTVHRNGDFISWQTKEGITCAFSPEMYARMQQTPTAAEDPGEIRETVSYAVRGNAPASRNVYLVAPYYGYDSNFTEEYITLADEIAANISGTRILLRQESATINAVADAMADGGVVLLDSHGLTDYSSGDDHTSNAHTSYLCLQTGVGITTADYIEDEDGVSHALYFGRGTSGMEYFAVDGTVLRNHMREPAESSLIWMAFCYGMATDGFAAPLYANGAAACVGYTRAVTFGGDQCWAKSAFSALMQGSTLADAAAQMKSVYGAWDYSPQLCAANGWSSTYCVQTLEEARSGISSFPIVLSAQDTYPGKTAVNDLQQVKSTWKLLSECTVQCGVGGSVVRNGNLIKVKPEEGFYMSGYTVLPENAARITRSGDSLYLEQILQDCVVTIQFAAKTPCTVHLHTPDGIYLKSETIHTYLNDCMILPLPINTPTAAQTVYQFLGWTTAEVETAEAQPELFPARESWQVTREDLYALYRCDTPDGSFYTTQRQEPAPEPADPAQLYADFIPGAWYDSGVRYAVERGLMVGFEDGLLKPNDVLTRAQIVAVLYRLEGSPTVLTPASYTDVSRSRWYTAAVDWAAAEGIIAGYPDGTFRPDVPVTREQLVAILHRCCGEPTADESILKTFPDASSVSNYARGAFAWAIEQEIVYGISREGAIYLGAQEQARRAQFACLIERIAAL